MLLKRHSTLINRRSNGEASSHRTSSIPHTAASSCRDRGTRDPIDRKAVGKSAAKTQSSELGFAIG